VSISYDDRTAILDLISEYAYTFDENRIDEHVSLFLEIPDKRCSEESFQHTDFWTNYACLHSTAL